jgi:hypothetical protein
VKLPILFRGDLLRWGPGQICPINAGLEKDIALYVLRI